MADFKKLQLDGEDISPVTHEAAVLNDNNESIAVSYQTVEDDDLNTDDKSIVGAINEVSTYGIRMNDLSDVIEPGDPNNPILVRIEELENTLVEYIINNPFGEDSNEGKQLIATAIGEPLNAEDTFAAMSDDIKGLLSTFKTNMMNNGVVVETKDKFKELIDKVGSMVEEDEDGIYQDHILDANNQVYKVNYYDNFEGRKTFAYTSYTTNFDSKNESYNGEMTIHVKADTNTSNYGLCATLDFVNYTPIDLTNVNSITIVAKKSYIQTNTQFGFLDFTSSSTGFNSEGAIFSRKVEIAMSTSKYETYSIDTSDMVGKHCICIESKFTGLTNKNTEAFVFIQQITLNTTEKPTDPLRDSLASILEEEGVEVSEEDDMAGLISKVDNEFDRKNEEITAKEEELANSGGLDIISATALPATGKENQICVITTGNVNKILVSNKSSDLTNATNNVCVYLGDADSSFSGVHTVTSGNVSVVYNIDRVSYNNNNVNSYVYKEGQWVQLTQSSLVLMLNAAYVNTSYGSFPVGNPYANNTMSNTSSGILMSTSCSSSSSQSLLWSSLPKAIDFGPFSKITASINVIESTRSSAYFYLLAFNSNTGIDGSIYTSNMTDLAEDYTYVMISKGSTGEKTLTFDVSNLTGEYYLGIALLSNKNSESGSYASSFHRAYLTDLSLR